MADLARAKQIAVTVLAVVRDGLAPFEYGDIYNRASLAGASIPRRIDMLTTADRLIGDIDRPEAAVLPWPLNSAEMAGEAAAIALIANNLWDDLLRLTSFASTEMQTKINKIISRSPSNPRPTGGLLDAFSELPLPVQAAGILVGLFILWRVSR